MRSLLPDPVGSSAARLPALRRDPRNSRPVSRCAVAQGPDRTPDHVRTRSIFVSRL